MIARESPELEGARFVDKPAASVRFIIVDRSIEPSRSQIQRKAENIEVNEADDPHREDQGFKHLWTAHLDPSRLDNQLGKNMQPGEDHEEQRRPNNVEIVRERSLHEAKGQPISHHGVMKPETRDQGCESNDEQSSRAPTGHSSIIGEATHRSGVSPAILKHSPEVSRVNNLDP